MRPESLAPLADRRTRQPDWVAPPAVPPEFQQVDPAPRRWITQPDGSVRFVNAELP